MMGPNSTNGSGFSAATLSMRDLMTVVFKRRWMILLFAAGVLVMVGLTTLLAPPTYEVEATLLVNKSRAEVPIGPRESQQLIVRQVTQEEINSEIEILKSRQLLEEMLEILNPKQPPESGNWLTRLKGQVRRSLGSEQLSFRDQMVVHLQEELSIESVRRSNVIRVSYRSKDPELATEIVGTLTERYLEKRARMHQSPQALSFFEDQMIEAEQSLAVKESALEGYLASAGLTMVKGPEGSDALATQKGLVMARLSRIKNELADAEVEMEESQYRVSNLTKRMAAEPERLQSSSRLNQDAAAEEVEKGLAALELERDRLLQDFKPDSRYVQDIDTQIRLARQRLTDLQGVGGSIDGTEINPIHQELKSELLRAEARLDGAQGRFQSLQNQVMLLGTELERLNEKAFELERLQREAEAAEESYLLYRKKHEEARISAAMDQQKIINVSVAQPAQKPLKPLPRRLGLNLLLAITVGFLGGLGLAFGTEFYLDHTFTTGEEMERRLGLQHLASIPEEA